MLILELKNYIIQHPRVSIIELSQEFSMDLDQIRLLLEPLIANGKLDKFKPKQICGSCNCSINNCSMLNMELYSWKS